MKRSVLAGVILAVVVLVGCAEYERYATAVPQSPGDLTAVVTLFADAPEPLQATAQAIAIERYATAQAAEAVKERAEAELAVVELTRQAAQDAAQRQYVMLTAEAQMTAEAHAREIEQQHVWATQQSANATQVAQATAQAVAVQLTQQAADLQATAEAWNRQTTATAQHRADLATATAQAVAWKTTATRQEWAERTTATAETHRATAQAHQATATRAAEKREVVLGYGRDYGIPLVLFVVACGIGALIVYGIRQQARRPVVYPRSVLGDAEPMALQDGKGGWTFVDLDRQPGPALQLSSGGEVKAPLLRNASQEERTTARDQAVDAATRPKLGGGREARVPELPAPPQAPAPGLRSVRVLRRLDQAQRAGFLPPPLVESIQTDWEESE